MLLRRWGNVSVIYYFNAIVRIIRVSVMKSCSWITVIVLLTKTDYSDLEPNFQTSKVNVPLSIFFEGVSTQSWIHLLKYN